MKLYTSGIDERRIERIRARALADSSPEILRAPKWWYLRLAISVSLKQSFPPPPATRENGGKEYFLAQVTGEGKPDPSDPDLTDAIRAILSVHHREDLFASTSKYDDADETSNSERRFLGYLTDHVQRGLQLIDDALARGESLERFLANVLFADVDMGGAAPSSEKSDELLGRLLSQGVRARIEDIRRGPRLDTYLLKLGTADALERIRARIDELAFSLGLPEGQLDVAATSSPLVAALYVPRPPTDWETYNEDDLASWVPTEPKNEFALPAWIGVTSDGRPYVLDIVETPHVLVAGTTGSGKSACLHAIICSVIMSRSASDVRLTLIDPKGGMEFAIYDGMPHLGGGLTARDTSQAERLLSDLVDELEVRTAALAELGASSLGQARAEGVSTVPWRVIVVDELADLVLTNAAIEPLLVRLAQVGRAAGMHLVLATQRPDAKTLSGLLRANIPSRIALKVAKTSDSQIVLDAPGAERLLGKGDMIARIGAAPPLRLQGMLLERRRLRELLKSYAQGE